MSEQHLEVERTYAVATGAELPAQGLVVGEVREHELEAVYLDTSDLALLRAGITLRRRTGGDDAGWHVKTPAGPDSRTELQHLAGPGDDVPDAPPAALLEAVRAVVRDRELVRVATIRNRRRELHLVDDAGRDLATLCDDHVSAAAGSDADDAGWQRWREWELELAPGRPAGLLDELEALLLVAGAEPAETSSKLARVLGAPLGAAPGGPDGRGQDDGTAGAVVRRRLASLLAELQAHDAAVRAELPDGVHQMRVACRRIRSVLTSARTLLAPGATDELRSELRVLGQVLGRARDAEVMDDRLRRAARAEPAEQVLGPVLARIGTELHREHARALVGVRDALGSPRYFRLLAALEALVEELPVQGPGGGPAREALAAVARKDTRRVRRAVRAARSAPAADRDELLHEVRKSAKRLRYCAELAEAVGGAGAARLRRRAKALQQALGEHQDSVVARGHLRRLGVQAHLAGENGYTFGLLAGAERLRAERAEQEAQAAWDRLPSPGRAERWVLDDR